MSQGAGVILLVGSVHPAHLLGVAGGGRPCRWRTAKGKSPGYGSSVSKSIPALTGFKEA